MPVEWTDVLAGNAYTQYLKEYNTFLMHEYKNQLTEFSCLLGQLIQNRAALEDAVLAQVKEALDARLRLNGAILRGSYRNTDSLPLETQCFLRMTEKLLRVSLPFTVRLHVAYGPSKLYTKIDFSLLQSVLTNLSMNAQSAINGKGNIWLSCTEGENHTLEIRMRDDGCGMTEEVAARAFEPAFTTKAPGEGTGFGLPFCAAVMKEYRGSIRLESVYGQGTCVILTLPACDEPKETGYEKDCIHA